MKCMFSVTVDHNYRAYRPDVEAFKRYKMPVITEVK